MPIKTIVLTTKINKRNMLVKIALIASLVIASQPIVAIGGLADLVKSNQFTENKIERKATILTYGFRVLEGIFATTNIATLTSKIIAFQNGDETKRVKIIMENGTTTFVTGLRL